MLQIQANKGRGGAALVAATLLCLAQAAAGGEAEPELRCEYNLRIWKGLRPLGMTVGSVALELSQTTFEGQPARLLRTRTIASCLGLNVDAGTESYLTPDLARELFYHYLRRGSDHAESKLVFRPPHIEYQKVLPVEGTERAEWRLLATHRYQPAVCDMFAAIYLARADGLAVGGEPRRVRCVADRKLWDIGFRAAAREAIEVPAGRFETIRLELSPSPANSYTATLDFRGPFALGPDTTLWVDPDKRLVVKLAGTAHLAVAVRAEMTLVRVTRSPAAQ